MGYFMHTIDSDMTVHVDHLPAMLQALKDLNAHDELKSGGRYPSNRTAKPRDSRSTSNTPDKWFAWMDWNYDETQSTITGIFQDLGFTVEWAGKPERSDIIDMYMKEEKKSGDEEHFLRTIAPYVEDGSHIDFEGEDGDLWRYSYHHGVMSIHAGRVVFDDDITILESMLEKARVNR